MKATELRVNNWYKSVKFNIPVPCDLVDFYELCVRSDGAYGDPPIDDMFEPIPLTEEWLLKFGIYEPIGIHNSMFSGLIIVEWNEYTKLYEFCVGDISLVFIKYVHQLQNLYFALTGEELTINL